MAVVNMVFGSFNLHDEFFAKHQLNYLADIVRVLVYTGRKINVYDVLVAAIDEQVLREQVEKARQRLEHDPSIPVQRRLNFEMSVRNLYQSFADRERVPKIQGLVNECMTLLDDELSVITGPYDELLSLDEVIEQELIRRAMWITAEMMTDLYNHDLHSRDVTEQAIEKYNQYIKRCNRAIEAAQHGSAVPVADTGHESCKVELNRVVGERDEYLRQLNDTKKQLATKEQTLTELSLRVEGMSVKSVASGMAGTSVELTTADPNVVRHINNLQERIYVERKTNKRLKGA